MANNIDIRSSLLMLTDLQVNAKCSHVYDRKKHEEIDLEISNLWKIKTEANPRLYDASKFRLHSWSYEENLLQLHLGLTCYKDYVCTNMAPNFQTYQKFGLEEKNNCQAFMADPLAVGAYLESKDNKLVLIERSAWCEEEPGVLDRPGGHPEPQELIGSSESADLESLSSESLVSEIFDSIQRELRDELNLDFKYMTRPLLLSIFRNQSTGGRPIFDFYIRSSLSSSEIETLYRKGTQPEADESTNILFVNTEEFLPTCELPVLYDRFSSSLKTSLPFYQAYLARNK